MTDSSFSSGARLSRGGDEQGPFVRRLALIVRGALKTIIAIILTLFFAVPMLWAILAPFDAIPSYLLHWPREWTFEHFSTLFANPTAMGSLLNSLLLAGGAAILAALLGAMLSYAFSRIKVPGRDVILYLILLVSSVGTGTAAMVPLFQLMNDIGLIDSQIGVILVMCSVALPTVIFILKDFMDGVPRSYEESARLMGAKPLQILWDVVVPIVHPGIVFVFIWTFEEAWSDFLVPYLLLRQTDKQPAAVTMYTFYTEGGQPDIGMLTAFALLFSIPVVLLYLLINRRWGFATGGGLKG